MDEFGFLQGWMIVFIVPRVKQSIWKGFKSMEPARFVKFWVVVGEHGFGKLKREDDEISRGYRMIDTSPLKESTKR